MLRSCLILYNVLNVHKWWNEPWEAMSRYWTAGTNWNFSFLFQHTHHFRLEDLNIYIWRLALASIPGQSSVGPIITEGRHWWHSMQRAESSLYDPENKLFILLLTLSRSHVSNCKNIGDGVSQNILQNFQNWTYMASQILRGCLRITRSYLAWK